MEWNRIMYPGAQGDNTEARRQWYEDNGILDIFPNMILSSGTSTSYDNITITTPFNDKMTISFLNMTNAYSSSNKPMFDDRNPIRVISRTGSSIETSENSVQYGRDSSNAATKICFDTFTDNLNNKHLRIGYENISNTTFCAGIFSGKCLNLNTNREEDYYFMWKTMRGNAGSISSYQAPWGWVIFSNAVNLKVGYSSAGSTLPPLLNTHGMTGEIEDYIITRVITQGRVFPFYTIEGTNLIDPYEEFILDGKRWYSLPFGIVIPLSD